MSRLLRRLAAADRWLLAITCGALLLRLAWLGRPSLWFDEALELARATGPLATAVFGGPLDHDPPLLALFYRGWTLFGTSEIWLRLPSVLAGTAAVYVTGCWARRVFDRPVARPAALFMAVAPVQVHYSQELNQYAWVLLLTAASLLAFERVRERGAGADWALYTGLAVTALATYYGLVFPLLAQGLYLVAWAWRQRARRAWLGLAVHATACALAVALLWWLGLGSRLAVAHAVRRWGWPSLDLEWAFFHDVVWREVQVFYLLPFSGGLGLGLVRLLVLAAVGGGVHLWRAYAGGRRALSVGLLAPLALTYVASGWALYPFGYRHGLFVTPALLTALAGFPAWWWRRLRPVGMASVVAIAAVFLAFAPQRFWDNPWLAPPREELRPVVAALAADRRPDDVVYVYDAARYAVRYYWPASAGPILWGEPFDAGQATAEAARITAAARSAGRLWLVYSHVEAGEDQQLVGALARHGWVVAARITAPGAYALRLERAPTDR